MLTRPIPRKVKYVRLSPTEWGAIVAAAAAEGESPSSYIRRVSVRAARRTIARAAGPRECRSVEAPR